MKCGTVSQLERLERSPINIWNWMLEIHEIEQEMVTVYNDLDRLNGFLRSAEGSVSKYNKEECYAAIY